MTWGMVWRHVLYICICIVGIAAVEMGNLGAGSDFFSDVEFAEYI